MVKKVLLALLIVLLCFSGMAFAQRITISENGDPVYNTSTVIIGDSPIAGNNFNITGVGASLSTNIEVNDGNPFFNISNAINKGEINVDAILESDTSSGTVAYFWLNTYAVEAVGSTLSSTILDSNSGGGSYYSMNSINSGVVKLSSFIDVDQWAVENQISSIAIGSSSNVAFTWNP